MPILPYILGNNVNISATSVLVFHNNSFQILIRGTVFARMAPDQKTQLVEALQELGYV